MSWLLLGRFWQLGVGLVLAVAVGVSAWNIRGELGDGQLAQLRAEYQEAVAAAQQKRIDDLAIERKRNDQVVQAYVGRLLDADAVARRLSDGLRQWRERAAAADRLPAADPAGGADDAPAESGDGSEVDAALGEHLQACAADAEALRALQDWARGD